MGALRTLRDSGTRIRLQLGHVPSLSARVALVFGAMGATSFVLGFLWDTDDTGYADLSVTLNLAIAAIAALVWFVRRRTS